MLSASQGAWACEKPQVSGYSYVGCLTEGLAEVKKNGKWGFIDKTGKEVIAIQYKNAENFYEGWAVVSDASTGKYGFIDKTGQVVIPLKHNFIYSEGFSGGRVFAKASTSALPNRGTTYYISKLGDEYTGVGSVSEGLAWVENNNKYGFIDTTGKVVIPLQYDSAWSFKNGQVKVRLDDGKTPKYFYIDKTGKVLTKRTSLAEFRKKLTQGDDVSYGGIKGMIFEIKGNLVQVQTTESQCTQRDYKGNCQNYVKNPVAKWVKRSEIYPVNHFD